MTTTQEQKQTVKLYVKIARLLQARINCWENNNREWFEKHTQALIKLEENLPRGSGFDCGTKIFIDACTAEKIVFKTSFHHMNNSGYYDGWTYHNVIVKPSLSFGFTLSISGKDKNDIKDYIADIFNEALEKEVE